MRYGTAKQAEFFTAYEAVQNVAGAARQVGIAESTATRWVINRRSYDPEFAVRWMNRGKYLVGPDGGTRLPLPGSPGTRTTEAERALGDFAYFRYRYLGRRSTPWQEEAAYSVVDWVTSPNTEYIVVNVAPGSGKSTLFVNDIPLWLICRDRLIRILIGSSTGDLAAQYSNRIRRMLERTRPLPAAANREQASGCLAVDYGRFKPDVGADIWRRDEFTVLAPSDIGDGESSVEDKEPTVSSYGENSEFLGSRANLVVWDDLVTNRTLRSMDAIENQRKWWTDEAETRVEPGGALVLQGQRLGAEDLYRYALDQTLGTEDDDTAPARYQHVLYPAHFEDRCQGDHGTVDRYGQIVEEAKTQYPEGCLLDSHRLPWYGKNGLLTVQKNRMEKYRVVYQQEDVDPQNVLVPKLWIDGGRDRDGTEYPGCWDHHRDICNTADDLPVGLSQPWFSIVSVDPSPTAYWAAGWWLYHPASEQRFLLDLFRGKMDAPDFLDWNENTKVFHGLAHDWQERSQKVGAPITHWIVEQNAAQRFLLQSDATKRWQRLNAVTLIGHNTVATNKLDETYGIQSIRDRYKYGNVRLPGKKGNYSSASWVVQPLVREATRYPDKGTTDDCLMQQWFLEFNLPSIAKPVRAVPARLPRPSWMRRAS